MAHKRKSSRKSYKSPFDAFDSAFNEYNYSIERYASRLRSLSALDESIDKVFGAILESSEYKAAQRIALIRANMAIERISAWLAIVCAFTSCSTSLMAVLFFKDAKASVTAMLISALGVACSLAMAFAWNMLRRHNAEYVAALVKEELEKVA